MEVVNQTANLLIYNRDFTVRNRKTLLSQSWCSLPFLGLGSWEAPLVTQLFVRASGEGGGRLSEGQFIQALGEAEEEIQR